MPRRRSGPSRPGWAVWCGWQIYTYARNRGLRALGVLYPILVALVVVVTGNHYLIDVIFGVVFAFVGIKLAPAVQRQFWRLLWGCRQGRRSSYFGSRAGPC